MIEKGPLFLVGAGGSGFGCPQTRNKLGGSDPGWMVGRRGRAESSARPHGVNLGCKQVACRLLVWDPTGMNSCFFFAQPRALHRGLAGVNARRRRMPGDDHSYILSSCGELRRDQVIRRLVGELCAATATGEPGHASVYEPQ